MHLESRDEHDGSVGQWGESSFEPMSPDGLRGVEEVTFGESVAFVANSGEFRFVGKKSV